MILGLTACLRRDGLNSDCRWPGQRANRASDLAADVEFAEELAIRYMDAHYGPRDALAASQAKNHCMGALLGDIGKARGVSAQVAFRSFGRRSLAVDLAILLPFALLYGFAADLLVRRLFRRYPPGPDRTAAWMPVVIAAAGCAVCGMLVAEAWSTVAEMIRVGNSHLSNRSLRLPVAQHPGAAFLCCAGLFLAMATRRAVK